MSEDASRRDAPRSASGNSRRAFDKLADQEQARSARPERKLAQYQAQLNAALDLDKNEMHVAPPAEDGVGLAREASSQASPLPPP